MLVADEGELTRPDTLVAGTTTRYFRRPRAALSTKTNRPRALTCALPTGFQPRLVHCWSTTSLPLGAPTAVPPTAIGLPLSADTGTSTDNRGKATMRASPECDLFVRGSPGKRAWIRPVTGTVMSTCALPSSPVRAAPRRIVRPARSAQNSTPTSDSG